MYTHIPDMDYHFEKNKRKQETVWKWTREIDYSTGYKRKCVFLVYLWCDHPESILITGVNSAIMSNQFWTRCKNKPKRSWRKSLVQGFHWGLLTRVCWGFHCIFINFEKLLHSVNQQLIRRECGFILHYMLAIQVLGVYTFFKELN